VNLVLCCTALMLSSVSAILFLRNSRLYLPPPEAIPGNMQDPKISVLIPARNEAENIADALRSVLANQGVDFEVLVGDDCSDDDTPAIVTEIAQRDPRVRLLSVETPPQGWNGKQHASQRLAEAAANPLLCFLDADVRLAPDALSRIARRMSESDAQLLSGVPRQETRTWMEQLLIPLIHFVLLGYLPLDRMRAGTDPAYAAGCGQLMLAWRTAYRTAGGHAAIRSTLHDGLKLPAAFRRAGFKTDLFDATPVAHVRMYRGARQVWHGLSKNATEGMASASRLPVFTLLLFGGHVAPLLLFSAALHWHSLPAALIAFFATMMSYLPRVVSVRRFHQPPLGAVLHPLGVLLLLAIQWCALGKYLLGGTTTWKGRSSNLDLPTPLPLLSRNKETM
jgi:glycosyl transferase family 2